MICELLVRDERTISRIINLAHRFTCRTVHLEAMAINGSTAASFSFAGPKIALERLRAQIERIIVAESADDK